MKSLKVALMLIVFCLTVSGSSYDNQSEIKDTLEINKDDFKFTGPVKGKIKVRGVEEIGV